MLNNNKIRCLVIDDEPLAREILKQHIAGVEALELTGTCSNAVEAVSFLKQHPVDLLFLDIQMPQLLGTNFIRTLKNPPKTIFTTAYRKYAIEGFELDAVDYILKPISFERFLKAVNKVLQMAFTTMQPSSPPKEAQNEPANSFLYFRADRKMVKVFFRDILFIEGLKDYIKIVTDSKTIVTKYVLSTLEEMLPASEFLRIHKSYIIAIHKIESFNADTVQMAKHELPIGRLYKFDVSRVLNASSASN
ncbi:MAG: response regulator transcription factor [Bacteroidota bacterium]|nr:response regulator transcription factor [Flavisolibacter sp.]MBD0366034.1 response regulator transcription factor [Flavisolibacter sp.]MBD0375149.1 response regulator transcription factor [Flavisolibacter sp.]MDQ3843833.1 response regulator transcription factor [Bacteroidota bacterium]